MRPVSAKVMNMALAEAVGHIREAATAKKCWACGCFHTLLDTITRVFPTGRVPTQLEASVNAARKTLVEAQYPCLGCEVCHPALVVNALSRIVGEEAMDFEVCSTEKVVERQGWPPLPGAYQVLRYQAPVAVCTLMDNDLTLAVASQAGPEIAMVGTLQTENLGIERLIQNVLANPHLRFLLVCGPDSRQAVGHWPGQSLVALFHRGIDDRGCIIGAQGKRAILKNISREAVEHFCSTVAVVDLLDNSDIRRIMDTVQDCGTHDPGPADPFPSKRVVESITGYLPPRIIADPAGYFVVYVDRSRGALSLEHYQNNGVLDAVIEGGSMAELYTPVIDKGLVSRLDHAFYLGRELAKAEHSLKTGAPYVQDAAPAEGGSAPLAGSACGASCREDGP
jgi:tetrahydromethanopterin S-methyltransferase subunit A